MLGRFVPGGEPAAVAVITVPGADPEIVWQPSSLEGEPAFLIYSITKTFTATLFLLLSDARRLDLDDPLARWFPRIVTADRITLRHLLTHTSGIPDYGHLTTYHQAVRTSPSTPWSVERFAAETVDKGLVFSPGQRFAYSNPGYMLLKRIVEDVAGDSYAVLVRERIAHPLGLARTVVVDSIDHLAALAPAVSTLLASDRSAHDVRGRYHPGWVSHGVIASTPSEIARFFDALASGRLVSTRGLDRMLDGVPVGIEGAPRTAKYGLGVMIDTAASVGFTWGHNGGGPGYSASAFHARDLGGATVCAMTSVEDSSVAPCVVDAVFRALAARQ